MDRKLYFGKDAKFQKRADSVLSEISNGNGKYYDADELADISDYFAINNMPEKMQKVVEYGLHLHPDNIDILIQEAYMYLDRNELDQLEACLRKMPDYTRDVKQLEALLAYRKGDQQRAEEILQELIDDFEPGDTCAIVGLMLDLGKPQEALDFLTNTDEELNKDFYLDNLATCYHELGMTDKAIETINQLIDRYPYQPHLWKVLGEYYFDDQQYDKCIESCDFALTTDEDYHPALLLKALAYQQLGNPEKALECIRQAADLGGVPYLGLCYFEMILHYENEQWEEAVKVFDKTMAYSTDNQIDKDNNYVYIISAMAALCYLHMRKSKRAYEMATQLLENYPDSPELWLVKAVVQMQREQIKKAHTSWEHFIQCPNITFDLLNEAFNYCMEHEDDEYAYIFLKMSHEMEPDNKRVNLQLLLHALTFGYKEDAKELIATASFDLPAALIDKIKKLLEEQDPDPFEMAMATTEIIQACPGWDMLKDFVNVNFNEIFGLDDEPQDDERPMPVGQALLHPELLEEKPEEEEEKIVYATKKKRIINKKKGNKEK